MSPNAYERYSTEHRRLIARAEREKNWNLWGPYLAERAWGTVREDQSADGNAWDHFTHDHSRSRVYRWNEDGLLGFCDRNQFMCFSLGAWNQKDNILKERLFGLRGPQGNHGEDVKELYWYLDSTPTHSFASARYRYPLNAFPYQKLLDENAKRGYDVPEYELSDTGVLDKKEYADITVHYAKANETDILISIDVHNASAKTATVNLVPQFWFRNTWSWGYKNGPRGDTSEKPSMSLISEHSMRAEHCKLGNYYVYWQGSAEPMFTENETNHERFGNTKNASPYVKDAFHRHIIKGESAAINPKNSGTKFGLNYTLELEAGGTRTVQLRFSQQEHDSPFNGYRPILNKRRSQADDFYEIVQSGVESAHAKNVQRQALAGMLWSKQLYYYDVNQWINGDPNNPVERQHSRNKQWTHLNNFDVMSMPDTWEYPWYAVWDSAFHCLPLAMLDIGFAKRQLEVITRERYMHPNGQLPAYEWSFDDVNPPVHAWAAWKVYLHEKKATGQGDVTFLEGIFHKLLLNFGWWVNNKDGDNNHLYQGGFLGLDNISAFDRSHEPPKVGAQLSQADATGWMGFFATCMLQIALELAETNIVYQEIATKFYDHFLRIAKAIHGKAANDGLWDEADGFFYDELREDNGHRTPLRIRSLVGLLPLIAGTIIEDRALKQYPDYVRRMDRLLEKEPGLACAIADIHEDGVRGRHLLSLVNREKLERLLVRVLDEKEFLSPHGIRSMSRLHSTEPFTMVSDRGQCLTVSYEPAESHSNLFGGNSNWRGPVWFPMNFLIIDALRQYHQYYGKKFQIECPTGSGTMMNLSQVADHISERLTKLFSPDEETGRTPYCGTDDVMQQATDENMHLFFEYFDGDTGRGLGANHQTGWTGLIAMLLK